MRFFGQSTKTRVEAEMSCRAVPLEDMERFEFLVQCESNR